MEFTETKPRAERKHIEEKPSGTYEDMPGGIKTFIHHNRKTVNEMPHEKSMGTKKRIQTVYDARNGMGMVSNGDKIYKSPEYAPQFYKEGGLIAGSS